jgi:hypothetical protein
VKGPRSGFAKVCLVLYTTLKDEENQEVERESGVKFAREGADTSKYRAAGSRGA